MSMLQWVYGFVLVGALALAGCARNMSDYGGAPLANTVETSVDQRVTVVGEVDEVRGEQTFTLKNSDLTAPDDQLLIIAEQPVRQITMGRAMVFRGERLQVYGMVRRLDVSAMEHALGFALDPDLAVKYDNRPVVVTHWISEPQTNSGS